MINTINMNIWGLRDNDYKRVPTDGELGATSQKEVDYTPLYNYVDNKNFLSIKDNNVDVKGSRIKNLDDPNDDGDAANKRYVNTRKTKCYVGYIPHNYENYGFRITLTSTAYTNAGRTVFNQDETRILTLSLNTYSAEILINCPFPVNIWHMYFRVANFTELGIILRLSIKGSTNNTDWTNISSNIGYILTGTNVHYDYLLTPPNTYTLGSTTYNNPLQIEDATDYHSLNINTNTNLIFKYYKIIFDNTRPVEIERNDREAEILNVSNFQLYVYND